MPVSKKARSQQAFAGGVPDAGAPMAALAPLAPPQGVPDETLEQMLSRGMQVSTGFVRKRKNAQASSHGGSSGGSRFIIVFSGKRCVLCQESEEIDDHVVSGASLKWGYTPNEVTHKNEGEVCHYCLKTYRARFRAKFNHYKKLLLEFGTSLQTLQCFKYWRSMAIRIMIEHGCWEVYIRWGSEECVRKLILYFTKEVKIEDPTDEIMEWQAYVLKYGDPRTNGRGHRFVTIGNISGVLIPGAKIWKIRRSQLMQATIEEIRDEGDFQLGKDQLELQMDEIAAQFLPITASGQPADHMNVALTPAIVGPFGPAQSAGQQIVAPQAPPVGLFSFSVKDSLTGAGAAFPPAIDTPTKRPRRVTPAALGQGQAPSPSASPGATPTPQAKSRGRGRPSRDLDGDVRRLTSEFAEVDQSSPKFFGSERKRQLRWMQDLVKALEAKRDTHAPGNADYLHNEWHRKHCQAIVELSSALSRFPVESFDFAEVYGHVMHFLEEGTPVTDLKVPDWMHQAVHRSRVERAAVDRFWKLLGASVLREMCFDVDNSLVELRIEMMACRVTAIVRVGGEAVAKDIADLFDPGKYSSLELNEGAIKEAGALRAVAMSSIKPAHSTLEDVRGLEDALAIVDDSEQKVAHALLSYPAGREVREIAAKNAAVGRAFVLAVSQGGEICAAFEQALDASSSDSVDAWQPLGQAWTATVVKLTALVPAGSPPAETLVQGLERITPRLLKRVLVQHHSIVASLLTAGVAPASEVAVPFLSFLDEFLACDGVFAELRDAAASKDFVRFCKEHLESAKACGAEIDVETMEFGSVALYLAKFRASEVPEENIVPVGVEAESVVADWFKLVKQHTKKLMSSTTLRSLVQRAETLLSADIVVARQHTRKLDEIDAIPGTELPSLLTALGNLASSGRKLDDKKFTQQAEFLITFVRWHEKMGVCDQEWSQATSPESKILSEKWVRLVLPLRQQEEALGAHLHRGDLASLFKPGEADTVGHISIFDDLGVNAEELARAAFEHSSHAIADVWKSWQGDLAQLVAAFEGMGLPPWEPLKSNADELLTQEMRQRILEEVTAPRMVEIIGLCNAIASRLRCAALFQKDGFFLFEAEAVQAAVSTKRFGLSTCALAYALFRLFNVLPKEEDPKTRAKAATNLRKALMGKEGFQMFPSLDNKIKEFEDCIGSLPSGEGAAAAGTTAEA